ncbi:hypothetical protein BV25DRAFT_1913672 [Artomyces pyxidatus]|uniref:Uncharacterized protein n=1 Tax=Artomyces pyxidatus TaxID=48021 RepID=A0ACB8TA17_9AGAM|nr:hypothetical protein BV25DRAFT_1913672 [Artomyces pyxidatus]
MPSAVNGVPASSFCQQVCIGSTHSVTISLDTDDGAYTCPLNLLITDGIPVDVVLGRDWAHSACVFLAGGSLACPPDIESIVAIVPPRGLCLPSSFPPVPFMHTHVGSSSAQQRGTSAPQQQCTPICFGLPALPPMSIRVSTLLHHIMTADCFLSAPLDAPVACVCMRAQYPLRGAMITTAFQLVSHPNYPLHLMSAVCEQLNVHIDLAMHQA